MYERKEQAIKHVNFIELYNLNVTEKVFKHFGAHIVGLEVVGWQKEVVAMANRHCTSLMEFHLYSCEKDAFDGATTPFLSVEKVFLGGGSSVKFSGALPFNELFPKLRFLSLDPIQLANVQNTSMKCSNLKHLHLPYQSPFNRADDEKLNSLIRMNPTIRFLSNNFVSILVLKTASEHLPNLESL